MRIEDNRNILRDQNGGTVSFDAFNRQEVANPFTEGDYTFSYNLLPDKWQAILTGTGAVTHEADERRAVLTVPATSDKSIFSTRKYHIYQAAKGGKVVWSCTPGYKLGTIRRWGYFDANNGLFFEIDASGVFYCVQRSNTSGSVVDTKHEVTNADWIDFTKNNIFALDFQWLGAGTTIFRVEDSSGNLHMLHKFQNPNVNVGPYMASGNMPVRFELESVTATADVIGEDMRVTCVSVVSSGGTYPPEVQFEKSNGSIVSLTTTAETPILAIRLANLFNSYENRGLIFPSSIDVSLQDGPVRFKVYINPTISGGTWAAVASGESMAEANTTFTFTSGTHAIYDKILLSAAGTNNRAAVLNREASGFTRTNLTLNASGDSSDILVLTAKKINSGDTPKVAASLSWGEVK